MRFHQTAALKRGYLAALATLEARTLSTGQNYAVGMGNCMKRIWGLGYKILRGDSVPFPIQILMTLKRDMRIA